MRCYQLFSSFENAFGAQGDSLLVSDGGRSDIFGLFSKKFVYAVWCIIDIFLGLLMEKFDKVSASLSFSSKYCGAVAENVTKHLIFMYHQAMSIFLGSKMSWI